MSVELTVLLAGIGAILSFLLLIWNRIEKLDEKMTDIDRRLCRIEGIMSARDCCVLKDDSSNKKAL